MNHNFESPKKRKLTKEDWKNLFSGLKDLLPFIIVGAFLMIGAAIIEVISPTYLGDLTREISSHAVTKTIDLNLVQNFAIILVILYVTVALAQTIGNFLFTTAILQFFA